MHSLLESTRALQIFVFCFTEFVATTLLADQADGHVKVYVAPVPRTATEADVSQFPCQNASL